LKLYANRITAMTPPQNLFFFSNEGTGFYLLEAAQRPRFEVQPQENRHQQIAQL
jgi:hypothetical protein